MQSNSVLWDCLWRDVHLATMVEGGEQYGAIFDGALAIKDGRIAWLGAQAALDSMPGWSATRTISGHGGWITPGLVDCHTHLVYGGDRTGEFELRMNGASYQKIAQHGGGILSTVRATRAASEDDLLKLAAARLQRLLREGVTTVEIKSGYGLDLSTERKMLRVARRLGDLYPVSVVTTFLGLHALPPEYAARRTDYIQDVAHTMLPTLTAEGLVDAVDAFCENIGFSLVETRMLFDSARQLNLPVKLHAEQLSDQRGAALAAEYQALSADHLEYVSEHSVRAMAETGVVAVLLPGAFYYLRETKQPPVDLFRRYGVPIAVATDCNPGTSPTTSLLTMMNMACVLFGLTPQEALAGVTREAARALGLALDRGTLDVGKRADLALWDIESPASLSAMIGGLEPVETWVAGERQVA